MKRNIKIICFILFTNFFINTAQAQAFGDSISIIVSPGTDKAKIISDLKILLKADPNVHYVGYCSNHNAYLLYVNKTFYPTQDVFMADLESASGVNTLLLKKGTVEKIKDFCSFSDPVDAAAYKYQLGH